MTTHDELDRQLATWLDDSAGAAAPDYLDETLRAIGDLHQRRAWTLPGRWLPARLDVRRPFPVLAVAALLLVSLLIGLAAVGGQLRLPAKLPAPFGPARTGLLAFDMDRQIVLTEADGSGTRPLLPSAKTQFGATFSRDGTRVAFWQEDDFVLVHGESKMSSDLWVVDVDGSHPRNLTPGLAAFPEQFAPAGSWSPDGSSIAFTTGKDAHLYVVATDGSSPPRSIGAASLSPMFPAWAPDGSLIAFTAMELGADGLFLPASVPKVYVIRPDGTGQERVSRAPGGPDGGLLPQWSPDGRSLLYESDVPVPAPTPFVRDPGNPTPPELPGPKELVIAERGPTGWTQRVVVGRSTSWMPRFSNDGSRLAFLRSRPGMFEGDLFVVNVDGSGERMVSDRLVNVSSPCWSPDDRLITMVRGPVPAGVDSLFGFLNRVYALFPVDGGVPVEIPAGRVNGVAACSWQRLAP